MDVPATEPSRGRGPRGLYARSLRSWASQCAGSRIRRSGRISTSCPMSRTWVRRGGLPRRPTWSGAPSSPPGCPRTIRSPRSPASTPGSCSGASRAGTGAGASVRRGLRVCAMPTSSASPRPAPRPANVAAADVGANAASVRRLAQSALDDAAPDSPTSRGPSRRAPWKAARRPGSLGTTDSARLRRSDGVSIPPVCTQSAHLSRPAGEPRECRQRRIRSAEWMCRVEARSRGPAARFASTCAAT